MKWSLILVGIFMVTSSVLFHDLAAAGESDLVWSTFLGGSSAEEAIGMALDDSNHVYIVGYTYSTDFPVTAGVVDTTCGVNADAIVAKLSAQGDDLIYATYLGGGNYEDAISVAVDGAGCAYVTGATDSYDFPTTPEAYDTSYNNSPLSPNNPVFFDSYITKLNPEGDDLVYSTYLGSFDHGDGGIGIAVDDDGYAYTVGIAGLGFPVTSGVFDTSYSPGCGYVAKFNPDGSTLVYSTYLGGSGANCLYDVAVDADGNAFVTGSTEAINFPTTPGAFDVSHNGSVDGFIVKLNTTGSDLHYGTFIGGDSQDWFYSIAIDQAGDAYLAGYTTSANFPTTSGAFDVTYNGGLDGFVAKLNSTGSALLFSTFIGTGQDDMAFGIGFDKGLNVYLSGQTESADFPVTVGAYDESHNGGIDAFLLRLNPSGSHIEYGTFMGGGDHDWGGLDIDLDDSLDVYIAGGTMSNDFPVTAGAVDETHNGYIDAFVAKFDLSDVSVPVALVSLTAFGESEIAVLEWVTASEMNCHGWEIYRGDREDGEYAKIGELPGQGSTESQHTYRYVDRRVTAGGTYCYKLKQLDLGGGSWWSHAVSVTVGSGLPRTFVLHQNCPNPFNATTRIGYAIPKDEHVTLKVYNVAGAEVVTLVNEDQSADFYTVSWNAEGLASGMYFCAMKAGDFEETIKMAFVR